MFVLFIAINLLRGNLDNLASLGKTDLAFSAELSKSASDMGIQSTHRSISSSVFRAFL